VSGEYSGLDPRWRGLLIALAVASFCLCAATVYNGAKAVGLSVTGRTTEATVVKVERFPRGDIVTIRFTADDREITADCAQCPDGLDVGDRLTVLYSPRTPEHTVEPAGSHSHRALALFTGAIMLVALAGVAFVGRRLWRDRHRHRAEG